MVREQSFSRLSQNSLVKSLQLKCRVSEQAVKKLAVREQAVKKQTVGVVPVVLGGAVRLCSLFQQRMYECQSTFLNHPFSQMAFSH